METEVWRERGGRKQRERERERERGGRRGWRERFQCERFGGGGEREGRRSVQYSTVQSFDRLDRRET